MSVRKHFRIRHWRQETTINEGIIVFFCEKFMGSFTSSGIHKPAAISHYQSIPWLVPYWGSALLTLFRNSWRFCVISVVKNIVDISFESVRIGGHLLYLSPFSMAISCPFIIVGTIRYICRYVNMKDGGYNPAVTKTLLSITTNIYTVSRLEVLRGHKKLISQE